MEKDESDIYEIVTTTQNPMINNRGIISYLVGTLVDPIMKPYYVNLMVKAKTEDIKIKSQLKEDVYFRLLDTMTELGMQNKMTPELISLFNSQFDQLLKKM